MKSKLKIAILYSEKEKEKREKYQDLCVNLGWRYGGIVNVGWNFLLKILDEIWVGKTRESEA